VLGDDGTHVEYVQLGAGAPGEVGSGGGKLCVLRTIGGHLYRTGAMQDSVYGLPRIPYFHDVR
jgi:hypothetical protein